MKVCLIGVCHGSFKESLIFLDSIGKSLMGINLELDIFFVENSSQFSKQMKNKICIDNPNYQIKFIESDNLGYFPSAIATIKSHSLNVTDYEYLIISNVDLAVSNSFFANLQNIALDTNVGIYAPSILSSKMRVDRNPKILNRPNAFKLKLNYFFFSSAISYAFLTLINFIRLKSRQFFRIWLRRVDFQSNFNYSNIYAPHGSFVVFTNEFFQRNPVLDYPIFLFGEEIYVAEKSRESNLDVRYAPNLVINDTEHASTSLMKNKKYRSLNTIALSYLLKEFEW
jgi:hypothetical protein